MNVWRLPVALLVSLGTISVGPLVASQDVVGDGTVPALDAWEILIQSDHEGSFLQRVTTDIVGTRWLWRSEGSVLLYEETPMAGGYVEERRTLGSPVADLTHAVGCEVGPLTLGPILFGGIYHRLLDPAAGGTEWSALTDQNTIGLDRGLDPGRWTGVGVSGVLPWTVFGVEVAPGATWCTDDETEIAAVVLPVSWRSGMVACSLGHGSFSVTNDDSWLHEAPPVRTDEVVQVGSTISVRPTVATVSAEVGIEGWRQRVGYRPPRQSLHAFGRALGEIAALTARISRTDSGFRALTGRRPGSSRFAGVTLSEGGHVRPWIWNVSWDRRAGWEDDLPGPAVDTYSATVGLGWRRGVTRLLRLQNEVDSHGTYSLRYRIRLSAGLFGLLAYAHHRVAHPTAPDRFSASAWLSLRSDLGRRRRRVSANVGWNGAAEEHWEHSAAVKGSFPLGGAFRLELFAKVPFMAEPTAETMEWLLRLRHTGPNRRREVTIRE